jgi:hypothetical protein
MKKTVLLLAAVTCASLATAQVYVRPHVTKNGTYVEGYQRTAPDSNLHNNYSTQGNTNPYTGQQGTVDPYAPPKQPSYSPPQPSYGQQRCDVASNGQYICR